MFILLIFSQINYVASLEDSATTGFENKNEDNSNDCLVQYLDNCYNAGDKLIINYQNPEDIEQVIMSTDKELLALTNLQVENKTFYATILVNPEGDRDWAPGYWQFKEGDIKTLTFSKVTLEVGTVSSNEIIILVKGLTSTNEQEDRDEICPKYCVCGKEILCPTENEKEINTTLNYGEGPSSEISIGESDAGNYIRKDGVKISSEVDIKVIDSKIIAETSIGQKTIVLPDKILEGLNPDQVNAKLEEDKTKEIIKYRIENTEKAKLFFLIPVDKVTITEINAESGEIIFIKNPWWSFLAKLS